LHNYFFPNSEASGRTNIKFSIYLFSLNLPKIIQADEIREIMRKQLLDSISEIDNLLNYFLRALERLFVDIIIILIEVCWKQEYHSRKFKKTRTVALRKSNKRNYRLSKVWRSIAFLNIIGKLIEAAAAKRLRDAAKTYILFFNFQMRIRFNRFTEIIFEFLIKQIHIV
jgi:hypothetical protein